MASLNPENDDDASVPVSFFDEVYGDDDIQDIVKGESADEGDSDDEGDNRVISPIAPPYSPHTPAAKRSPSPRSRSRSPLWQAEQPSMDCVAVEQPLSDGVAVGWVVVQGDGQGGGQGGGQVVDDRSGVVIVMFDENGVQISSESTPQDTGALANMPMELGCDFFDPDAHVIFGESRNDSVWDESEVRNVNRSDAGDWSAGERMNDKENRRGRVRGGRRGRGRAPGRQGCEGVRVRRVPSSRWESGHPLEEIWTSDADVPSELMNLARDVVRKREERMFAAERKRRAARISERQRDELEEDSENENDDEVFQDATDERGNPLLGGDEFRFEWFPMDSFQGVEEPFLVKRTGSVKSYSSEYKAFRSYWDDGILQQIVEQTNLYASRIASDSFQSDWHPTDLHEILCLFAFWMMLGIIRMPTIKSCFSVSPLLKTEIFRRIFTYNRYTCLVRALHFIDCDEHPINSGPVASFDRLYRLRPIIDHLNNKFRNNYVLSQNICIDESLTLWKGRLNFKQYIPLKAAKFGIKTYELCESTTGYLWSFIVYTGKQTSIDLAPTLLKSSAIVKTLMTPLLNKGYRLFMDNWYNSPLLARWLKRNRTDCVGTLRSHRLPPLLQHAPLKRGQLVARHSGDVCVMTWMDKKRVNMISTCHGSGTALSTVCSSPNSNRPEAFKPHVVLDYNKYMGGVDLKDQKLEPYLLERKRCAKWYMKLFKRLLNVSVLNARVLLESSTHSHRDHLTFRLNLVNSIVDTHLDHALSLRRNRRNRLRPPLPTMVQSTHWLVRIPQSDCVTASNRATQKYCYVCKQQGRKTIKTIYMCEGCNVPLCVLNCHKIYHTTKSFKPLNI